MDVNYIALAIPVFLVLIGVELLAARAMGQKVFRLHDAVVDMSCGVSQQVTMVFLKGALLAGYVHLYQHRLLTFEVASPMAWVIAFFAVDFLYYWWHRLSHEVNVLWAVHVVHHQSEEYNLPVALRQAAISSVTIWPFYAPLALLGIPPVVFVTIESLSVLYQFWIHTRLIGPLGRPVEAVLNTPSHHRVHHAINPRYLDRNYGATLIVWDRLFRTFEKESEAPVYGIVKPLRSFQPLWAQVHYWVELWRGFRAATRPGDRLKIWFASPAWAPAGQERPPPPEVSPQTFAKYDPPVSRPVLAYVGIQFLAVVAGTFALMSWENALSLGAKLYLATTILLSVWAFGALFESRRFAFPVEGLRLALIALGGVFLHHTSTTPDLAWTGIGLVLSALLFVGLMLLVRRSTRIPPTQTTAAAA